MANEIDDLLKENERRHEEIFGPYDPITGEGCYGYGTPQRVLLQIPDMVFPKMWVPKECMNNILIKNLLICGSIKDFVRTYYPDKEDNANYRYMVQFMVLRIRFKEDPEFAMYMNDKIVSKQTGELVPFRLNYPQRRLLKLFEDLRHAGEPIRVVILKARQWGGSTLTQLYIKWMQDYRHQGWNSIILAQVKGTSKKIKAMYRVATERQPGWTLGRPGEQLQFSPYEGSTDDFIVTNGTEAIRNNTITVASFDNFDNVRGSNFHCAHYSEVAYWKETPEHDPEAVISSIGGGILNQPDNIEVFESTGRGASGFFYERCQLAMDPANNDAYKFIFIPFYIIENDMEKVKDKRAFAKWLWDNRNKSTYPDGYRESGKFFWKMWKLGASFESINWYRITRNKYKSHSYMATEAPIDPQEAFRNSGNLIFNPYSIDDLQEAYKKPPIHFADIVLSGKKGREMINTSEIKFRPEREGEMKIWAVPNANVLRVRNRYLVSVDIGGNSDKADYTVMTVIDRFGMIQGMHGKPKVVARWRSHCRHDVLAWKAAALAHYYDDALLVIESNTADREKDANTEGDHFGTIIEEIADYYDNLYQRTSSPEDVTDNVLAKFGFQTNKLTKGWIIDNMIAMLDDMLWEEPDMQCYQELRIYERHEDGTMGNIKGSGNHDDIVMSTAIGLWVCMNDMPKPSWVKKDDTTKIDKPMTEATI